MSKIDDDKYTALLSMARAFSGQLKYELKHLKTKLKIRDIKQHEKSGG